MKLSHKICGAALLAVVGVGAAAPSLSNAASKNYDTTGHVKFTDNTTETTITAGNSETDSTQLTFTDTTTKITTSTSDGSGGSTLTEIETTTSPVQNPGDFGIYYVSPLEFGEHDILDDGVGANREFEANFFEDASEAKTKTLNFVTFKDTRDVKDHNYSLYAKVTQPFTSTKGTVLDGATLTYTNPWLSTYKFTDGTQDHTLDPKGINPTVELGQDGAPNTFIDNQGDNVGNTGAGKFTLSFGKQASLVDEKTAADGVKLTVPRANNAFNGDFTAKIMWTLSEEPAPK